MFRSLDLVLWFRPPLLPSWQTCRSVPSRSSTIPLSDYVSSLAVTTPYTTAALPFHNLLVPPHILPGDHDADDYASAGIPSRRHLEAFLQREQFRLAQRMGVTPDDLLELERDHDSLQEPFTQQHAMVFRVSGVPPPARERAL